MSLSLSEQHVLANDGLFISKLKMALLAKAEGILEEDSAGAHSGTAQYVARMGFAQQMLADPQGTAERAAQLAAVKGAHVDPDEMGDAAYVIMAEDVILPMAGYNPHYIMATV